MQAMAEATIAAIPDRAAAAVGRLTGLAYMEQTWIRALISFHISK
jgi:hypothetical protein